MNRRKPLFLNWRGCFLIVGLLAMWTPRTLWASQPLETETARTLKKGSLEVGGTFEYQTSPSGKEKAAPFTLEYGLTDRLELMVEPVFYTAIRPKTGRQATGMGDTEATLSYLFREETQKVPALAFAAEVKIPTAKDSLIGTRRADYAGYFIASKRFGKFDVHGNIGYTVLGQPPGCSLDNVFNFALASEYMLNPKIELVGELLGITASSPNAGDAAPANNSQTVISEASGGELVAMLGARYYVRPSVVLALGVTYDNNDAVLVRSGITFKFR